MKKRKKSNKNITINISNRWMYTILTFMILILGVAVVNSAWTASEHSISHDADDVKIDIEGIDKSLQEAFNDGDLGGSDGYWTNFTGGIHYSGGMVGINKEDPNNSLDINGNLGVSGDILSTDLYLDGGKVYFESNKLCYTTEETCTCNLITSDCGVSPTIYQTGALWDCTLDETDLSEDCNKYCISMGDPNVGYNGYLGDSMIKPIRDIITQCNGDQEAECGGGTTSSWTRGSYHGCEGELICECSNPSTYQKETTSCSGGNEYCLP